LNCACAGANIRLQFSFTDNADMSLRPFRCFTLVFLAMLANGRAGAQVAKAAPVFQNGMAQIVPAFQDTSSWIRQNLWVETDFDSDKDGRKDRIHVDVTRPPTDTKLSVLYSASPYFAGTGRPLVLWPVDVELGAEPKPRPSMTKPAYKANRTRISGSLISDWVPRGFAVVHSEQPGTGRSQGCPTIGDYPERAPMKFVVDWLNGRAKGFTTIDGNEEVKATSWSTGKVGMMGTSYEGTLPLAAATTGVEGLEVVVPIAPNTSYYHYYRSNGLVRSPGGYLGEDVDVLYDFVASGDTANRANCDNLWKTGAFAGKKGQDRVSGDMNDFWAARDLVPLTKNVKAAVLLSHGFNDYNVMPDHSTRVYDAMKAAGRPVSMHLHQGGHGGPPPFDMLNRWFSHYLYGVDNGVEKDPPVWIVPETNDGAMGSGQGAAGRGGRGNALPAKPFASFPVPGTQNVSLRPTAGGNSIAALSLAASRDGVDKFVDDVAKSGSANAAAEASSNRLLYATPVLTDTVHISGTPTITLRIASSKPAANLTVWLVMLPYDSTSQGEQSRRGSISRGWADIQNHKSLTKSGYYTSKSSGEPLEPGKFYDITFDMQPADEFIPAGKRLAVMIMSSDREFTLWPSPGTTLTVDLTRSSFSIPIVGGVGALNKAGMH
jgi:X-Pro dipeptidyl-peptidase